MMNWPEAVGFVLGATFGYLVFDLMAMQQLTRVPTFSVQLPSLAALNFLPVLPALGAALAARRIASKNWGFLIVGAVASSTYILSLVLLVWVTSRLPTAA